MARYVAALVTHIRTVTEAFLEHMQKDNEAVYAAFEEHLRPDKVAAQTHCFLPDLSFGIRVLDIKV